MEYVEGAADRRLLRLARPRHRGAAGAVPQGLRGGAVRAPEPRHPSRHQAGQRPGHRGRHAQAARLRHRQAAQPRDGRPDARADRGRAAADDARVRQPRAGARRAGHDRHRRLLARRPALRAADRAPAVPHHQPRARRDRARRLRVASRCGRARRSRNGRIGPADRCSTGDRRRRRRPRPLQQPLPRDRHRQDRAAAAPARRRSRQHRAQGAQQGAGAALRLGRPVRRGRPPAPAGSAGDGAQGHARLSRVEVRRAATGPSRRRRVDHVRRAGRRHRRHRVAGAGRARRARRAEQRFDDVRRLANAFLFDVHDAIRDLPGSTPARSCSCRTGSSISTSWRPTPATTSTCAASWRRLHPGRRRAGPAAQSESRRHAPARWPATARRSALYESLGTQASPPTDVPPRAGAAPTCA